MTRNILPPGAGKPVQEQGTANANASSHSTTVIRQAIDNLDKELREVNSNIHSNPELCYDEHKAHANIISLLETQNIKTITPHAYNIDTSFVAEVGSGGRLVTLCAEYDALPGIGHGCGHNLIATSSIAAFFGVAAAIKDSGIPGRVRLLGCPAEEGGAGKVKLIDAGAFEGVDAALMAHPSPPSERYSSTGEGPFDGMSYATCLAACMFNVVFTGKSAHAAAMPWDGINALDAATLAYSALSMLRQQIRPSDRINIAIMEAGKKSNIITDQTVLECGIRCETFEGVRKLRERAYNCFKGAALATGCKVEITEGMAPYADLQPNETLCLEFTKAMRDLDRDYFCNLKNIEKRPFSTDMGNVSYTCPSFHGLFNIPAAPGTAAHSVPFADAAGTDDAHQLAIGVGKGMAVAAYAVLSDNAIAKQVKENFERRRQPKVE